MSTDLMAQLEALTLEHDSLRRQVTADRNNVTGLWNALQALGQRVEALERRLKTGVPTSLLSTCHDPSDPERDLQRRVDLKPCPFCGGAAKIEHDPAVDSYRVRCSKCHVRTVWVWMPPDKAHEIGEMWGVSGARYQSKYETPPVSGSIASAMARSMTSWEAAECLEQYLRERGYFVQVNFWQDETTVHITDKTSCVVLGGASGGPGDLPGALARAAAEVLKGKKEGE